MSLTSKILLSVLVCLSAFAQEKPRAINFALPLVGMDAKPIINGESKTADPMTLSDVSVAALETVLDEDRSASGAVKFERDELARKVYKATAVVLTAEQIATIKERIGKVCPTIIVGAAWRMLDPAAAK